MYFNGQAGLTRDEHKAKDLFQRAADHGDAGAIGYLGFMYENGKGGLAADQNKAVALYEQAAKLGDTFAKEQLQRVHGAK
jgi:TPR repeat protein